MAYTQDLNYVLPAENCCDKLGGSQQAKNIFEYLLVNLRAQTAVIESRYVDRPYLIDYSKFFSRSFEEVERFTKRIHFFSNLFSQDEFERAVKENTEDIKNTTGIPINSGLEYMTPFDHIDSGNLLSDLIANYLGFVVVKPLKDDKGNEVIGRTILKCNFNEKDGGNYIFNNCITKNNKANLYGIPLSVRALPFQVQDNAVAACATTSLWIANSKMSELFGTPELSPAQITEMASDLVEMERSFPSNRLYIKQMLNFIKGIELEYDIINVHSMRSVARNTELSKNIRDEGAKFIEKAVPNIIKAFVRAEIPIIAILTLRDYDDSGNIIKEIQHSVIICGYKENENREIISIYVHDDQIGPYAPVETNGTSEGLFLKWKGFWTSELGYDEVILEMLLIPMYPKIRLTYDRIYKFFSEKFFSDTMRSLKKMFPALDFDFDLYLTTVQNYKKNIIKYKSDDKIFCDKIDVLRYFMPRLMWVADIYVDDHLIYEAIFDATAHYPRLIKEIDFRRKS